MHNSGQKWYFSAQFGIQVCFDMCCALKLKVRTNVREDYIIAILLAMGTTIPYKQASVIGPS